MAKKKLKEAAKLELPKLKSKTIKARLVEPTPPPKAPVSTAVTGAKIKPTVQPTEVSQPYETAKLTVVAADDDRILIRYEGGAPLVSTVVPGELTITMLRKVVS